MEERYLVKPFSCWGQGLIDSPGQCAVPPLHLASPPSWLGQGCYITDTREPDYPSKCTQHCKNIELSMYTYNSKFIWITFAVNWHKKNCQYTCTTTKDAFLNHDLSHKISFGVALLVYFYLRYFIFKISIHLILHYQCR